VIGLVARDGAQIGEVPLGVTVSGRGRGELGRVAGPHDRQRHDSGHEGENDDG
jgi:hypothetical protein